MKNQYDPRVHGGFHEIYRIFNGIEPLSAFEESVLAIDPLAPCPVVRLR